MYNYTLINLPIFRFQDFVIIFFGSPWLSLNSAHILAGRVRHELCQKPAKNYKAPKLGGVLHFTITNTFRTGAMKV